MQKRIAILSVLIIVSFGTLAQPSIDYWDSVGYLMISGGKVITGDEFSSTSEDGLFAEDGFQVGLDFNFMITKGLGFGLDFEFNRFGFNEQAFMTYSQPVHMWSSGGYNSIKFGLNGVFNFPIVAVPGVFTFNLYAEGNAGLRGVFIPSIDLEYDEIDNYFVEVSYRSRGGIMEYLGYSTGVQFIFSDRFGINISYNEVLPGKHTARYSVRKFDAGGELYEDESYISNYLDNTGIQIGLMVLFGK